MKNENKNNVSFDFKISLNRIEFLGRLDESSQQKFLNLKDKIGKICIADLSRVSSLGADNWIRWIRDNHLADQKIAISGLTPNFIRTLNTLPEMIPHLWTIESFFVPYEILGEGGVKNIELHLDKDFNAKELVLISRRTIEISGYRLELDVDIDSYFLFLQRRYPEMRIIKT